MQARHPVAVGAFVVAGVLLFAVGLFLIGNRRMLFADNFDVYAEFAGLSGLQDGAKVRVGGMDAGEVTEIHVPASPSAKFRVKLRIRENLHPLVRVDSVASIQTDGLVGNKFVQVEAGTDQAQVVPPNGTISSREPFDFADLLQRMSDTLDLVTSTIGDVRSSVDEALQSVTDTANEAQNLMGDLGTEAKEILHAAHNASDNVNAIVAQVRQGKGTVGKLMTDDSLFNSLKTMTADGQKAVASLRDAAEQAKGAVHDFRGENGPMKGIAGTLQQTLASANDAMSDLAESTEALKRNFFFRGFFNKRGYFDLDDISVQQYRQGALETKDRRVVRIWIRADVLFEKDANGNERLTDDGRARLDSAMSQFVGYPRNTPFVVEGYAQATTVERQFLLSRSRAHLARDYVVGKFGLDPNYVAVMPIGAEAVGSPAGNQWDGVALALFISTSTM
jgi:phospholipid/cholesterol/gamma-HCH transport system substrate-binding protein